MPTLYITKPGGVLRFQNGCFIAEARGMPLVAVPAFRIDQVAAFGPIQVTAAAMTQLLNRKIDMWLMTRFGNVVGRLTSGVDGRVDVRLAQYEAFQNSDLRVKVSASIVSAKINSSRRVLMRYARNHRGFDAGQSVKRLKGYAAEALKAKDRSSLLGIEGSAAREYFSVLEAVFDEGLFDGRSRRPPADPANALMSLSYTLLGNEISSILCVHGLDPYIGMYHEARRGLPALAQDILEEFRAPVGDRLSISLLNTGKICKEDFVRGPKGGLRLKANALKRFLTEYEEAVMKSFKLCDGTVTNYRKLVDRQCRRIRLAIIRDQEYEPYVLVKS